MGHGAVGINRFCRLECSNRGAVVEAEKEVKSLVEVFLGFGRGGGDCAGV
jgi:hypothetical protein